MSCASGDATEVLLGRSARDEGRTSMNTMKGSTSHGVPEDLAMVGIGSMPPPEAGYDISDSLYMERFLKVEEQKRLEKRKEEEEEMVNYRMASSTASAFGKPRIAVGTAASSSNADQANKLVKVKLKRKSSADSASGAASGSKPEDTGGKKHKKKKKKADKAAATAAVASSSPPAAGGGALGLVAYSSDEE